MARNKLIDSLLKASGNDLATIASKGILGDINGYIDTGSYAFNALLSGSIYKGLPSNKILGFAGEEATGKSFYALAVIKHFLDSNPDAIVFVFETEGAATSEMLKERGIDRDRYVNLPVATVEDFRTQALKMLNDYAEWEKKTPVMFVLDSLGNLSTKKETVDIAKGDDVRDMTRTQLIKGAFRALTLRLVALDVPMIVTNHTYKGMSAYSGNEMSGGSGLKYAASIIVFLSRAKAEDGDEVVGSIITAKLGKSRICQAGKKVKTRLLFERGIDKYFGLIDLAVAMGVWSKISKKIAVSDTISLFESEIIRKPEKFFTKEVLDKIDAKCQAEFLLGSAPTNFLGVEEVEEAAAT